MTTHYQLWAKKGENQTYHPLIYHMLDVASVAIAMWELTLPAGLRQHFIQGLALDDEHSKQMVAFLAGLHDIGKASPSFQRKDANYIPELEKLGFTFSNAPQGKSAAHGTITAWALQSLLEPCANGNRAVARKIARVVGGHHGIWITSSLLDPAVLRSADKGDRVWDEARRALFTELAEILQPPHRLSLPAATIHQNALLTLLSGFICVADWIGSMTEFFPFQSATLPASSYYQRASEQARRALHRLGWVGWQPTGEKISFEGAFNFTPHPLQKEAITEATAVDLPAMVILEAPTGIGKTEAALYIADQWLQTAAGRGLYVAMPTQATSNQMFGRVMNFLRKRYPGHLVNLHLVHGQARFNKEIQAIEIQAINDDEDDALLGQVAAMGWFLPRKRSLLAPFGVGTVDQSLMSVLQTRHFFVRLFGLGSKVVVFDEVHAYDTYMSVLFFRLLNWLRAIGASVIILSATLPKSTLKEMICAYLGVSGVELEERRFPRLTVVQRDSVTTHELPAPETKPFRLEWIGAESEAIVHCLEANLADGGCAGVICNRVARAQEVYRAILESQIVDPSHLILFHARFPFVWREAIETEVLQRFGKGGDRPPKMILVATQVVEQSLDLDFDLIISDIAPVDLILQRAGRLHRHKENDPQRPARLAAPRLMIAAPEVQDGLPSFGADALVYESYFLTRTWQVLRSSQFIDPISETSRLIEDVYSQPGDLKGELNDAWEEMKKKRQKEIYAARNKLVELPVDEGLLEAMNIGLEEENPEIHQAFQAMTRLIEPGVNLICLHKVGGAIYLEPDGSGTAINLEQSPHGDLTEELIKRSVSLHHQPVVRYFQNREAPKSWKKIAALKYHHPVVFENGEYRLEGSSYSIKISRQVGIEIVKEVR